MFDSFVQLVVYSFSVEMYFRMDIVSKKVHGHNIKWDFITFDNFG